MQIGQNEFYHSLTLLGILLIILGVIIIAIPLIARYAPSIEKLPPLIIWIYKKDNFYFATSPLLIIISLISIILYLISRAK